MLAEFGPSDLVGSHAVAGELTSADWCLMNLSKEVDKTQRWAKVGARLPYLSDKPFVDMHPAVRYKPNQIVQNVNASANLRVSPFFRMLTLLITMGARGMPAWSEPSRPAQVCLQGGPEEAIGHQPDSLDRAGFGGRNLLYVLKGTSTFSIFSI